MSKNIASEVQPLAESHAANQESAPRAFEGRASSDSEPSAGPWPKFWRPIPMGRLSLQYICNRDIARKKITGLPPSIRWTESADEVLFFSAWTWSSSWWVAWNPRGSGIRRALNSKIGGDREQIAHLRARRGTDGTRFAVMGRRLEYGASRSPAAFRQLSASRKASRGISCTALPAS